MMIQICIAFMFSTSIYKQLNSKIEYTKVGKFINTIGIFCTTFCLVKFVFFFLNFLVYVNFTMVAKKWTFYVQQWEQAELKLFELRIMQYSDQQVKRKIWKIAIIIMLLAFGNISCEIYV